MAEVIGMGRFFYGGAAESVAEFLQTCAVGRPENALEGRACAWSRWFCVLGAGWLLCNDWVFMHRHLRGTSYWQATLGLPALQCLAVGYSVRQKDLQTLPGAVQSCRACRDQGEACSMDSARTECRSGNLFMRSQPTGWTLFVLEGPLQFQSRLPRGLEVGRWRFVRGRRSCISVASRGFDSSLVPHIYGSIL